MWEEAHLPCCGPESIGSMTQEACLHVHRNRLGHSAGTLASLGHPIGTTSRPRDRQRPSWTVLLYETLRVDVEAGSPSH